MSKNNGNNGPAGTPFDEEMCVAYLLGELSTTDQEDFETAYFTDDVFFDRFMAVKTELLDLYARGELEPEKQDHVKRHFLSTAPRRKQLADSRQFIDAVSLLANGLDPAPDARERSTPFSWLPGIYSFAWALAVVLLFIAAGIWWASTQRTPDVAILEPGPLSQELTSETGATRSLSEEKKDGTPEPVEIAGALPDTRSDKPATQLPRVKQRDSLANKLKATLVLASVATRDINASNTLRIYSDTASVSILVPVSRIYKQYSVTIATVSGDLVWKTKKAMTGVANKLKLELDPRALTQADYILTLKGMLPGGRSETVSEYYFHVVRSDQKTPTIK